MHSSDEILSEFNRLAIQTESMHSKRANAYIAVAVILFLFLAGMIAFFNPNPFFAMAVFLLGLHFVQLSTRQLTLAEMTQHHRALAQLIVSVTPKLQ